MNGKWQYIIGNYWYSPNNRWHFISEDIRKNDTIKKLKGNFNFYLKKPRDIEFKEYYFSHE
jgi:hypothetical protein